MFDLTRGRIFATKIINMKILREKFNQPLRQQQKNTTNSAPKYDRLNEDSLTHTNLLKYIYTDNIGFYHNT